VRQHADAGAKTRGRTDDHGVVSPGPRAADLRAVVCGRVVGDSELFLTLDRMDRSVAHAAGGNFCSHLRASLTGHLPQLAATNARALPAWTIARVAGRAWKPP